MKRIFFEVMVEALDAGDMSDAEEEDNIVSGLLCDLGYPEKGIRITAKVLRRERDEEGEKGNSNDRIE